MSVASYSGMMKNTDTHVVPAHNPRVRPSTDMLPSHDPRVQGLTPSRDRLSAFVMPSNQPRSFAQQSRDSHLAVPAECIWCGNILDTDTDYPYCSKTCAIDAENDSPVVTSSRKLTRNERLQALADSGVDTWDDYNETK